MDLVIVGVEASLWTAEQFGQDLKVSKADLALACTAALLTALRSVCLHAQKRFWLTVLHLAQFSTFVHHACMFNSLTNLPDCFPSPQHCGIPSKFGFKGEHESFFFVYSCCFSFHQSDSVDLVQAVLPALQITVISSNKLVAMLEHSAGDVTSADLSSGRLVTTAVLLLLPKSNKTGDVCSMVISDLCTYIQGFMTTCHTCSSMADVQSLHFFFHVPKLLCSYHGGCMDMASTLCKIDCETHWPACSCKWPLQWGSSFRTVLIT